jgi:type I restriction enzyme S subunit
MSEWIVSKLGDACDILDNLRVPLNSEEREGIQGEVPYYGANGLQGFINKHIFNEPLILLAEDGGYFDEFETRPIAYRVSGPSWVNNHAHVLRAKKDGPADQAFIFYSLEHRNITPFIKGGTRAKLNQSELREITVPHPKDKDQQRRIAEILTTVDEAMEQTEALVGKLEQMKAGLMHDLFTRGVTPDGLLRPTRQEAPHLYHQTPLGWLPKEWEIDCVGPKIDVIDPNPSHRYPNESLEGVPICSTENFHGEDAFRFEKAKLMPESVFLTQSLRCGFDPFDVVFARKGRIGLARRYGEERKVFSHTVVILKPKSERVSKQWLLWAARSHWMLEHIDRNMNTNLGVPTLGIAFIQAVVLPFPKPEEQLTASKRLDHLSQCLAVEREKLAKLRQQKQGLMQDLLTGRVRVNASEPS